MKKFALLACLTLTALGGASMTLAAPAKKAPAASAAARDWSKTVVKTADGGFQMGNPAAKVKLVEYGSMTCSHCAHFDETGYAPLVQNFVRTGKVAFEFRNFVLDPFDMAAALTARCGGSKAFFAMTTGLYKTRGTWIPRIQAGQEQLKPYEGKEPQVYMPVIAHLAGFDTFAVGHGVPAAQLKACLASKVEVDRVMALRNNATDVRGTPTFYLNGGKVELTGGELWPQVEDALKAALAG